MGISHALIAWSFYNTEHQIQQSISITQNSSEMDEYKNLTYFPHADAKQMERNSATTYLPLIGVVCFFLMFAIGTGVVPMVVLGEVFPRSIKGMAVSGISSTMWILNFGMAKMFFFVNDSIGMSGTFIFFGVCSVIMSFYVFALLPETKNKTLTQIQEDVEGKKLKVVTEES